MLIHRLSNLYRIIQRECAVKPLDVAVAFLYILDLDDHCFIEVLTQDWIDKICRLSNST